VRAKSEGFVTKVVARPGAEVRPHETLVALADPILAAKVAVIEAQQDETNQRLEAVRQVDRVQAEMFQEQAAHLAERLKDARERERNLVVEAERSGRFVLAPEEDAPGMPGRFVKRGQLLGYVIADRNPVVRLLASQADVDLIDQSTTTVEAYLAEDVEHPIAARILRESPAAQQDVPSLALTTRGGGTIALDPSQTRRPQALFSFFQLDVELLEPTASQLLGSRVYVRFEHPNEPIAWRFLRSMRQFFLGQFHV
jgi:putative peptide zinc metalloprotease protein